MKHIYIPKLIQLNLGLVLALGLSNPGHTQTMADASPSRPNILLVVADDMGTFDIGAFGSEIRTPNIDSLASGGLRFTEFHTSATCSPTRAMLLSGVNSHAAGMGNMIEHVTPNQLGQPGYEGYLSDRVVSVATLLQDAGYRTYMAGKWHLGKQPEQLPASRGFDESFVLLEGGASYFNDMMGLNALVQKANYRRNHEVVTELPDDFYASEDYADFIIEQIEAGSHSGSQSSDQPDQPFFAYLAFSAPHWPLQVRDEHVDLYKGQYDQGYDVLLQQRLASAAALGILAEDVVPAARPAHVKPWNELDAEQQKTQARIMEIYAAVVERMDFHLGRVLSYLENSGELENTLIIFMSDNGADGSDRSKLPGNHWWLPEAWDLSYENMGKIGSYVYPGAAWARTSVGPASMYKEFLSQGGIKAPLIISHPSIENRGAQINDFVTVKDITPTILEITDTPAPGTTYKGRETTPIEGISLLPVLAGETRDISAADRPFMGWELFGQRAIRHGDWKLLWLTSKPRWLVPPANADQWRLYNLVNDPGETQNLVLQEPEKFSEMRQLWDEYSEQQGVILPVWETN